MMEEDEMANHDMPIEQEFDKHFLMNEQNKDHPQEKKRNN